MANRPGRSPTLLVRMGLLVAALSGLTFAGIFLTERADSRRAVRLALADGGTLDDSLSTAVRAKPSERVAFSSAIALAYLARMELGLGSPFRLVDLARSDPRLPVAWRVRVANALLNRLATDGRAMRALPGALSVALTTDSGAADALLRVADSAIVADGATMVALESIRIAAAQASARAAFRPGVVPLIDAAALLAFDRVRARRDLDRVLAEATRGDGDVLRVVALWRSERRLSVEQPLLAQELPEARRVAARVPALLAALEGAASRRDTAPSHRRLISPLPVNAAQALSLLISVRTRPPQPQVMLSVVDIRILSATRGQPEPQSVSRFLQRASNEEGLVVGLASALRDSTAHASAAAAALLATQGMRTLAQEMAFHPGQLALLPEQVVQRYGLGSLTFAPDVPVAWQPFYAREFASSVDALRTVFPRAQFTGLHVRFGDRVVSGALAVHDPRTRTLTIPLATGMGAIGHELVHDLDWQAARDYSGREGTYATDNARNGARTVPVAARLARLAEFVPVGVKSSAYTTEARRPAELLARGSDWFLAVSLARLGRSSGALSSVQDSWIRGYASAAGPAAFGDHGAALAAVFDEMPTFADRTPLATARRDDTSPDLGAIARAAWFAPLPTPESVLAPPGGGFVPVATQGVCSPVAKLRLASILPTARTVAAGFMEPRVERAMLRWARGADTAQLSTNVALLRLAVMGAPMDPSVIETARAAWLAAAWRSLPCLAA